MNIFEKTISGNSNKKANFPFDEAKKGEISAEETQRLQRLNMAKKREEALKGLQFSIDNITKDMTVEEIKIFAESLDRPGKDVTH